jgi:transposase-like protein
MRDDHLCGLSFKDIGDKYGISKPKAYRLVIAELAKLPDNNKLTFTYCNRFSHIFEFDAKYIQVKGHKHGLAFLWGVDFERHDFPFALLAPSESYHAWATYLTHFRLIGHHPDFLVCDDNSNIKTAARFLFPEVTVQTCYNHFKEGVRRELKVRSDQTYRPFSKSVDHLLSKKRSTTDFNKQLYGIYKDYRNDPIALNIVMSIERRKDEFLAFQGFLKCPVTTNMIESFNKPLEERLKHINSFASFSHAKLWLNAYVLKRRYTKLTDCRGRFKFLNGKRPLEMTQKLDVDLPTFF